MTSGILVLDYLFGLGFFGFLYWLLNGVLGYMRNLSETGNVWNMCNYLWTGALIIYLLIGIFWLLRSMKEWQYEQ